MIKLELDNKIDVSTDWLSHIENALQAIDARHKFEYDGEVNLIITTPEEVKELSNQYKKVDKTTDVLTFPGPGLEAAEMIKHIHFGDIFINYERVNEQAKEYGHSLEREITYLFVHGFLHILGFSHYEDEKEKLMNDEANEIMNIINLGRSHG